MGTYRRERHRGRGRHACPRFDVKSQNQSTELATADFAGSNACSILPAAEPTFFHFQRSRLRVDELLDAAGLLQHGDGFGAGRIVGLEAFLEPLQVLVEVPHVVLDVDLGGRAANRAVLDLGIELALERLDVLLRALDQTLDGLVARSCDL